MVIVRIHTEVIFPPRLGFVSIHRATYASQFHFHMTYPLPYVLPYVLISIHLAGSARPISTLFDIDKPLLLSSNCFPSTDVTVKLGNQALSHSRTLAHRRMSPTRCFILQIHLASFFPRSNLLRSDTQFETSTIERGTPCWIKGKKAKGSNVQGCLTFASYCSMGRAMGFGGAAGGGIAR